MLKPTRIMVPTDFSEYADKALGQALDIAVQYTARVYVPHVIQEKIHRGSLEFSFSDEMLEAFTRNRMEAAQECLAKQVEKFSGANQVQLTTSVKTGIPYEAILEEEKERGIDLIVMGSRGKSIFAKYALGGVARNVVKRATCPVLLTK